MSGLARAAGAVIAAGAACVAYGTFIERRWYRLRRLQLRGALTAAARTSLRILHVADLHLAPPQADRVRFLASVAQEDYDLVVASGDLMGGPAAEDATVAALAPLTAGRPGIATLGSNDLFAPILKSPHHYFTRADRRLHGGRLDTARFTDGLVANGYRVLRNDTTVVDTPAGTVAVGGIDDPHLRTPLPPREVIAADPADSHALRLGVVHAPYVAALDLLVDAGYEVLLAGHTHGGQVRFPPVGAVVANCDLPLDQARGASRWRDQAWLHVTPGVGQSPYAPFRFACRPEVTLLHLTV